MKNLKLGFVALCGLLLTFSACKKDKNGPTASNSFVVNNTNYTTDGAIAIQHYPGTEDAETELLISKTVSSSTAKDYNAVWFDFYTTPLPSTGTFTYKDDRDPSFDASKNFASVAIGYNLDPWVDFYSNANFNSEKINAAGSTITISKNGNNYTFNYTLNFTDNTKKTTTIVGQYTGIVN